MTYFAHFQIVIHIFNEVLVIINLKKTRVELAKMIFEAGEIIDYQVEWMH